MFGLFAKQGKAVSVSVAERIELIEKLCEALGSEYRSLKQYNCNS